MTHCNGLFDGVTKYTKQGHYASHNAAMFAKNNNFLYILISPSPSHGGKNPELGDYT